MLGLFPIICAKQSSMVCFKTDFQVDQMTHSVKFPRAQEKKPGVVLYTYSPHAEIDKEGPQGLLASQPHLNGKFQTSGKSHGR